MFQPFVLPGNPRKQRGSALSPDSPLCPLLSVFSPALVNDTINGHGSRIRQARPLALLVGRSEAILREDFSGRNFTHRALQTVSFVTVGPLRRTQSRKRRPFQISSHTSNAEVGAQIPDPEVPNLLRLREQ